EVEQDIRFQRREFAELSSSRHYGCVLANPPYGMRMGRDDEVIGLYRQFPTVLRRLKTWSHFILSARPDLEELVGQQADRRRKLYNGRIACTLYQFFGPRPPRGESPSDGHTVTGEAMGEEVPNEPSDAATAAPRPRVARAEVVKPAFGGLRSEASRQAQEFANRLQKLARHLRRWPTKRGITCYRVYDRDIPEIPLAIDRYEEALHISEYERPHDRTPAEHADWLDLMVRTAAEALDVRRDRAFGKYPPRQPGGAQYEPRDPRGVTR
ncbi:MAG TPA: bifunctional 23S rRNA (guanine(2069)-N(7))-methyltransferase RlmK/23S rRNA (guanine(2445)-N(2))-methyltransferase RlmL, partial [Lacipirellulaceae bacterium]|nr:bifunctional 23S rRNA (guanine(2069)-N(7))-methyltransferase RlmK/23S rRNA (guanine(2445)-N(2))-methyltransferase RlmL [Lacipirellulaceae bacterium]